MSVLINSGIVVRFIGLQSGYGAKVISGTALEGFAD